MKHCPRCNGQLLPAIAFDGYPGDAPEFRCIQCGYTQETRAPRPDERSVKGQEYHYYRRIKDR